MPRVKRKIRHKFHSRCEAAGRPEDEHRVIARAESGFSREETPSMHDVLKRGCRARVPFGDPARPGLADREMILVRLDASRIGVAPGGGDPLWPEESTSAIVAHHPQAKYFTL